jgi:glycogen phosphorylase
MKAALNGAINCSILDGWWDECFDGQNGWAIGTRHTLDDTDDQDRVDASALYDLLDREIAPRFYDRSEGPVPRRWMERLKASMGGLGEYVTAKRMVIDYVEKFYEPAALQGRDMAASDFARARDLAGWKQKVAEAWDDVQVLDVEGEVLAASVGERRDIAATVRIGRLSTDDVLVQLAHGRVGPSGEIVDPTVVEMVASECVDGTCRYTGSFVAGGAGLYGFAVRVLPSHSDLITPLELGRIAWA